jgi:hypothetical protein
MWFTFDLTALRDLSGRFPQLDALLRIVRTLPGHAGAAGEAAVQQGGGESNMPERIPACIGGSDRTLSRSTSA